MNTFGRLFRVQILGESHGECVGVLIDGCPAGVPLAADDFAGDLGRRRSGASGTTPRREPDRVLLRSGVFRGRTTGAPILLMVENRDTQSEHYEVMRDSPRPGHADFTAMKKFGNHHDYRGSGHFSGRITAGLVMAGVVARKLIDPLTVKAEILTIGGQHDQAAAIEAAMKDGDSVGGLIECHIQGVPVGLGEPFFDSLESLISHAVFAVPAVKGIEFGAGFDAAAMRGSECNDPLIDAEGRTSSNHAGGINGGISNGNDIVFRVAVKPASSIGRPQRTFNLKAGEMDELKVTGRHDACIALRIPVVIEAAASIVMADAMLLEQRIERVRRE